RRQHQVRALCRTPGLDSKRQARVSPAPTEKKEMTKTKKKKQKYPPGWDETRVRKLAEHYDHQTEEEQAAQEFARKPCSMWSEVSVMLMMPLLPWRTRFMMKISMFADRPRCRYSRSAPKQESSCRRSSPLCNMPI